jgi:DNA-binding MarR family transcriptional regulator
METFRKQLKLKPLDFYSLHLSIINPLLPVKLSNKEIQILSLFMSFRGNKEDRFGFIGKRDIKRRLKLSSAGLSNYIRNLEKKGFIKKIDGVIEILPLIYPKGNVQEYEFKIVKDETH